MMWRYFDSWQRLTQSVFATLETVFTPTFRLFFVEIIVHQARERIDDHVRLLKKSADGLANIQGNSRR